jgi:ABC-type uncharacterized transport system fused permease/ATPase subunit
MIDVGDPQNAPGCGCRVFRAISAIRVGSHVQYYESLALLAGTHVDRSRIEYQFCGIEQAVNSVMANDLNIQFSRRAVTHRLI